MFERFTDRARRVVVLAQEESRLLNHNYIGTEHILLGLIHEGEGVAAEAIGSLGISLEVVRQQIEAIIGQGKTPPAGHIPFTPRAKRVLELSLREALQLGHNYIGTEHILLGLIREGEGVAAQVLVKLGADLGTVRQEVIRLLGERPPGTVAPVGPSSPELEQVEQELEAVRREKEEAIDANDFERAASIRDREKELVQKRIDILRDLAMRPRRETEQVSVRTHARGSAQARRRVDNPPGCPSCRAPLAESAAFRVLDVPQEGGGATRKVLFVFCGSCGITIDDEILPEA